MFCWMLRSNRRRRRQPASRLLAPAEHRQGKCRGFFFFFFSLSLGFFVQEPHPAACWWHHAFSLSSLRPSFSCFSPSLCPDVLIPNICTCWRCVFHRRRRLGSCVCAAEEKKQPRGSPPRLQSQSSLLSLSARFHLRGLSCLVGFFPQAIQFTPSVQYSRNTFLILMLQEPLQAVLFSSLVGEHVRDCSSFSL